MPRLKPSGLLQDLGLKMYSQGQQHQVLEACWIYRVPGGLLNQNLGMNKVPGICKPIEVGQVLLPVSPSFYNKGTKALREKSSDFL